MKNRRGERRYAAPMTLARQPTPLRSMPPGIDQDACVLAVDLGTGGPKVAVVRANGDVVAHAFQAVALELGPGGAAEQDPAAWWAAITRCTRQAVADSGVSAEHIVGIGCTAQWSGTVPIDSEGEALGPCVTWMDSRGAAAVKRQMKGPVNALGYGVDKVARWIRLTGGVPSLSGKDPVGHILFLKEQRPDIYTKTAVFLEPVDYLNLKLTGLARASFDSIAVHWVTNNRDINNVAYHPGLMEMAGLEPHTLPELVATGSIVGGLWAQAADDLGLLVGTPVVTGTGDLHSAAVGSGAVHDFDAHLYMGTSSWISCHVPFKKTAVSTNVASIPAGLPGRYLLVDEHETGGACMTWLCDNVLFPDDGLGRKAPPNVLAHLNDLAAAVPAGANGVLFTPWLNGERSPVDDHTIRAGFHNLSLSSTRSDMVRAVFEGVAFNTKWLLAATEKFCGREFDTLSFVGGGANSDLWSQIHADVTGRTVRQIADPVLANVRGAGLLTLVALGRVSVTDIPAMVTVKATYRPNPATSQVYELMSAEFVNLYKQTKAIHKRLNRRRLS
jgi:xylulokinase